MTTKAELKKLAKEVSDKGQRVSIAGTQALVHRKLDDDGVPLSTESFDPVKHIRKLSLNDLRFLHKWRANDWDFSLTIKQLELTEDQGKRVQKKVQCFRDEDVVIEAMAKIPTTNWITSKHLMNLSDGGKLEDSQRDSLKELAKIVGAYKPTTNLNIQANILQMPELNPEQAKAAREFFDTIAIAKPNAAA